MLTLDELTVKWNEIAVLAYKRVDADHPLDFYIGTDSVGHKELLLLSTYEPPKLISSKSIVIEIGKRHDSKWAVCYKLLKTEQEEIGRAHV